MELRCRARPRQREWRTSLLIILIKDTFRHSVRRAVIPTRVVGMVINPGLGIGVTRVLEESIALANQTVSDAGSQIGGGPGGSGAVAN